MMRWLIKRWGDLDRGVRDTIIGFAFIAYVFGAAALVNVVAA